MGAGWTKFFLSAPPRDVSAGFFLFVLWRFYREVRKAKHWQDTPIGVWLVENSLIGFIAFVKMAFTRTTTKPSFLANWLIVFIGGLISVDGTMLMQHYVLRTIYKHIQPLVPPEKLVPKWGFKEIQWDYLRTMVPTQIVSSGLAALAMEGIPPAQWAHVAAQPFRVVPFLFRFAVIRVCIDVSFYIVHRLLHSRLLYPIHKRHHEHVNTSLSTNYHFTPPDLALEGFIPVFFGTVAVNVIHVLTGNPWFQLLQPDVELIYAYAMWYEIGSHCGMPIPLTMFPPFAPVYNWMYKLITGNSEGLDDHNVLFHERHHNLVKCNYGITPWLDWIFGTAKLTPYNTSAKTEFE